MEVYSFQEFSSYLKLRPIKELKRKKQLEKAIVGTLIIGLILSECAVANAAGINTSRIDSKGKTILNIMLKFSRWTVLIMAGWEGGKSVMSGNAKAVPQIILKYALAYASLRAMPWIMSEIDSLFS